MKKFITFGAIFLAGALCATVLVWWYLQSTLIQPVTTQTEGASISSSTSREVLTASTTGGNTFTAEQIETAESFGVDLNSFKVTPEMIECAKSKLSLERIEEILGGDTPGFAESISLLGCLR